MVEKPRLGPLTRASDTRRVVVAFPPGLRPAGEARASQYRQAPLD
jgi:hypothetical protein